MKICFTYNVKRNLDYNVDDSQEDIEFDSLEVIEAIESTLRKLGHEVLKIEADHNSFNLLKEHRENIDLVFNIAEGLIGDARESQIPIFCEMLGIPYTHSSPTTNALVLDKHLTKIILKHVGIKSPKSLVVDKRSDLKKLNIKYPVIVKPNKEGSSKGIFNDSVAINFTALKKALARLSGSFKTDILIEEYIDGRELTVGLIGNPPRVLPIVEQRFDFLPKGFNKIAGYEAKWIYEDNLDDISKAYDCPAKLTKELQRKVEKTSLKIWDDLKIKDCARIDYRLKDNDLYFIEINTLPGINPDTKAVSYFPLAARKAGMSYDQMISEIVSSAISRYR